MTAAAASAVTFILRVLMRHSFMHIKLGQALTARESYRPMPTRATSCTHTMKGIVGLHRSRMFKQFSCMRCLTLLL